MADELAALADRLHAENCSCVIENHGEIQLCFRRGVADLFDLLKGKEGWLKGARVADKVVGKGAAALMIAGGMERVYADVISESALEFFRKEGTEVSFGKKVEHIINRSGTGICPVEELCNDCKTAAECVPLIENFINEQKNNRK